ncbi:MAG TPA: SMP-30/gluconolactonase/LRE family protein [Bacteriovoracaceae bacterium]|nr:SMP-30/gluconolactonase/LRE family protein [Bacteriovoracaceae bacterium]
MRKLRHIFCVGILYFLSLFTFKQNYVFAQWTAVGFWQPIVLKLWAGGVGGRGNIDSNWGQRARFYNPTAVALDGAGNMYVADQGNHTIRKITSAGVVTTLAGAAGVIGSTDASGAAARFNNPSGVAVDVSGNVYVADYFNHTIRKITSTGVVTTLAGAAGVIGSTDATGAAARFNNPFGVAVDGSGNVYVADLNNHTIRKITSTGVVTTLAGAAGVAGSTDATGAAARFFNPSGVAVDGAGNMYVADQKNHTIRKITAAEVVTTLSGAARASGSTDATGAAARLNAPSGVAVDGAGNVYVADQSNHTIRKITAAGVVTTLAGAAGVAGSTDATGVAARFNNPTGVAVDGSGDVYVTDFGNHTIRKITAAGVVTTLAGTAGVSGSTDATGAAARFTNPNDVAVDGSGNVFVADMNNRIIRKITAAGVVTTLAGAAGVSGSTDATGAAARFVTPTGLAVDGSGNVYVADYSNHTIRKITSAGVVTTLAGAAGVRGSTDATGAAARFNNPARVALDGSGNVYVADLDNHTIRKISSAGSVRTVIGSPLAMGIMIGPVPSTIALPKGITFNNGLIYFTTGDCIIQSQAP